MEAKDAIDPLSMERAISIALLRGTKSLAVRCVPGEKKPVKGWDPRANTLEQSTMVIKEVEFTKENFGIHLTGPWMDVDVDSDNQLLFDALDTFLPDTPHVWGRKSKPRSHRLYMSSDGDFDPSGITFLQKLKRIPEANVEIRGGPISRAEYSLLPGSVHPSGENYTWEHNGRARSSPAQIPRRRIIDGVRKAAAATVLAPLFTEGVRQELTMALSGFLQRVHQLTGEWAEETGGFAMGYAEALDFFKSLLKLTDDDKSDYRDRLAAFKMTWDKGAEGKAVTGATRIAEIADDKGIIQRLYGLLTDNPDVQRLEHFLQRYAIWFGTGDFVDMDAAAMGTMPIMSRQAASNSMGHEWYQVGDKRVKMVDYLYSLDSTTRIHGFSFAPGKGKLIYGDKGTLKINQWGGFKVEPTSTADGRVPNEDDVAPFIDYLRNVVCGGRKDVYEWVLAWVADIFADPAEKPGTALVLVGPPGAGKSSLGDIIRAIIGEAHTAQTNDIERVVAKHNTNMVNNLFIQCDEATNSRQKATTARLKSLVTDLTQTCEPKNVNPYDVEALARFLFTSNDERDAMHIPDGLRDRRFTILKVDESRVGDIAYWDKFRRWWKANLGLIMAFLQNHAYDKKKIRWCLTTPEKMIMVTASWSPFDRWVSHVVATGFPLTDRVHDVGNAVRASLQIRNNYVDRSSWPRYVSITHLVASIADAGKGTTGVRNLPSVTDVMADLDRAKLIVKKELTRTMEQEFDDRSGARRMVNYNYIELETLDKFEEYASTTLGHDKIKVTEVESTSGDDSDEGNF